MSPAPPALRLAHVQKSTHPQFDTIFARKMRDYCGMCKNRWWATWKPYGKLEQALRQKIAMNRTWRSTSRDFTGNIQSLAEVCSLMSTIHIFQVEPRHFEDGSDQTIVMLWPSILEHAIECLFWMSVNFARSSNFLDGSVFCCLHRNCWRVKACFCWLLCNCLRLKSHGSQVHSRFLLILLKNL